jgi:hypothetical protein
MPTSQFRIYTSEDRDGPGPINGLTGSLVSILNACLINGYGTGSYYKPAAGWIKPCPDSGSGVGPHPYCYAAFQMPSGSGCSLFVNDAFPAGAAYGEAWITGWEYISSSFPPSILGSNSSSVGQGCGQFPLPAQSQTYGALNVRKSSTNTGVARTWMIAADPYNVYMWIFTGDVVNRCFDFGFGDFYSLAGAGDIGRCLIYGRWAGAGDGLSITDCIQCGPSRGGYSWSATSMLFPFYGHYIANSVSGIGGSIRCSKKGDFSISNTGESVTTNYGYQIQNGVYSFPNAYDNSLILSPLWIGEPAGPGLRGKYRGLYQPCHYASSFQLGQIISGSGDFVGRTFMMIKEGRNSGHWAIEISPTVEAN